MTIMKKQNGAAVTTIIGLLALVSTVMTVKGTYDYGEKAGEALSIQKRMYSIHDEMKRTFDERGLSTAQAAIMKRRVDRNAALFVKLADRIIKRQGEILHAHSAFFVVDIATSAYGRDYKKHSDKIASLGRSFRGVDEYHVQDAFLATSGATSTAVKLMAGRVSIDDIESELGEIQSIWEQDESPFQKAMVSAKIRAFWDHMQSTGFSKERKVEWFRSFVKRLSNDGWNITGVDFQDKKQLGNYVVKEIKKYRSESKTRPKIEILSLSATPGKAKSGDTVRLAGQVKVSGLPEADISANFVAAGIDVNARTLSAGRSDVAVEIVGDWTVPEYLKPKEYGYLLTVSIKGFEEKRRYGHIQIIADPETGENERRKVVSQSDDVSAIMSCRQLIKEYDSMWAKYKHDAGVLNCQVRGSTSGCARNTEGCRTGMLPKYVFMDKYCRKPGYIACAQSVYKNYISCVRGCNDAYRNSKQRISSLTACGTQCYETADKGVKSCREK